MLRHALATATRSLTAVGVLASLAVSCEAARLTPVTLDRDGEVIAELAGANLFNTQVHDGSTGLSGPLAPWGLGEFRLALEDAAATVLADVDSRRVSLSTFSAARDTRPGDVRAAEANPRIGDVSFRVDPTDGDQLGDRVTLYLQLAWDDDITPGAIVDRRGVDVALTDRYRDSMLDSPLTSRSDSDTVRVTVGEAYSLALFQESWIRDGHALTGARLYAGLDPAPAFAAPAPIVPGDYNRDGAVDAADMVALRNRIGGAYDFALDGNGDGRLDRGDRASWSAWYGEGVAGVSARATPEPAAAWLAGLATAPLLGRAGPCGRSRRAAC